VVADVKVLNYQRNDSLVFDVAGKCILDLHSTEDMEGRKRHHAVKSGDFSKGTKGSTKPPQKTTRHSKKRRRLTIDDSDSGGDEDEPLGLKHKPPYIPDQSIEGQYFLFPDPTEK
jgi:hypothetical protein